jgi:hypothetical protein
MSSIHGKHHYWRLGSAFPNEKINFHFLLCQHSSVGISLKFVDTLNFYQCPNCVATQAACFDLRFCDQTPFVIWLWFTACERFIFVGSSWSLPVYCPVLQDMFGCIPFTPHFWSTCQSHKVSGKLNLSSLTPVVAVNCTTVAVVSCFDLPGLWGQMYHLIRWKIFLLNILGGPNFGCLRSEGK